MNAKTLFAAAAAMAMSATFGLSTTDFESYNAGDQIPSLGDVTESDGNAYFLFMTNNVAVDGIDESVVTNSASPFDYADPNSKGFPGNFATHTKHLALSTEGGTLWRSINPVVDTAGIPALGDGQDLHLGNVYVDTLVQFTVTEDEDPEPADGDKLAIWLKAESGVTNLCVKAGYPTASGLNITDPGQTNYTLSASVEPNTWYRLTVVAVGTIGGKDWVGFKIYLDGELLTVSDSTVAGGFEDVTDMMDGAAYCVFPSLSRGQLLQAVGFKGTGAVDDLVITDEAPDFARPPAFDFTLTWTENVTNIMLTLDGTNATIATSGLNGSTTLHAATVSIRDNRGGMNIFTTESAERYWGAATNWTVTGSITATDYVDTEDDEDYVFGYDYVINGNGGTIGIVYFDGSAAEDWVDNVADIPADKTVAEQYPTLASSAVATANAAQLTTWAKGVGNVTFDNAADINVKAFLLNIANSSTTAEIEEEEAKFKPTITISGNTITVAPPDGKTYNGTIQLKGSTDLSTWTDVEAASTSYQYYKFVLSL